MGQIMGTSQRREPAVAGPPEPMSHSIEGRARPASKGARSSPEFSTIWEKADLADTVVSFLPADSVGRLPLVSRAQRDAQPRVLFAAARERGVAGELALACVQTLRGAERNLVHHHFRETWSDGISERWFANGHDGCTAALVGTPPRLELQRTHGDGHGRRSNRAARASNMVLMSQAMTGWTLTQSWPWIWCACSDTGQPIARTQWTMDSASLMFWPVVLCVRKSTSTSRAVCEWVMHQHMPPTTRSKRLTRSDRARK